MEERTPPNMTQEIDKMVSAAMTGDATKTPEVLAGIGHNRAPTPYDERVARTQELVTQGDAWKHLPAIESQAQAERCNDLLALIAAACKENHEALSKEVDPLKAQVTEISGRYKRLGAAPNLSGLAPDSFLGVMAGILKRLKGAWLERQEKEKQEAERKAREEAAKAQRAADEAARNAKTIADQIAAEEAKKRAEQAQEEARRIADTKVSVKGEVAQRASGFRETWKATAITNLDDAIGYYKTRAEVAEVLLKLASADARAGRRRVPGFKIEAVRTV